MDAESSLRVLADASSLLLGVPRRDDAIEPVLQLVVPALADWAAVDLVESDGSRRTYSSSATGADAAVEAWTSERLKLAVSGPRISPQAGAAHGFTALLGAPLIGVGGCIGALTLAAREADRIFTEADLVLAGVLARYLATWIEEGRTQHRAEVVLRSRDRVLSLISHDLRTPLTTISGVVQLLLRRAEQNLSIGSPQVVERLALVQRAAAQLGSLIDEILDGVRLAEGRALELHPQPVDLVQLVRRAVRSLQDGSEESHLRLVTSEAEIEGSWDADRLDRVFAKILGNALRYSPPAGDVTISLKRCESPEGQTVAEVEIRDEGPGIVAAELATLLEPDARDAATRHGRGRLDLPGCRRIVEQHGGSMTVQSEVGKGTTFTLLLPLEA